MEKVSVALMWHQHQPCYRIPGTHTLAQPWVRLHTLKDYLDMPLILERYPSIHQTFNLVPSLVEQIQAYGSGEVTDEYLELSRKQASELNEEDKEEIADKLFHANIETMVAPFPRYYSLHKEISRRDPGEVCRRLGEAEWRDIQVWFNLAWLDPKFRGEDELPSALVQKGEQFTEEEKQKLLDYEQGLLSNTILTYKALQDRGLIEITTSPFYHPILPLLCD